MVVVLPTTTPEAMVTVGPGALVTAGDKVAGAARTGQMASNARANTFAELKAAMITLNECTVLKRMKMKMKLKMSERLSDTKRLRS